MNTKYRVVIVGCGRIGGLYESSRGPHTYSHGRAFSDHTSFNIVGCVDSDIHRAKAFSKKYGVQAYGTDIAQLVGTTKPQVVSICTPDSTHYEVTTKILSSAGPDLRLIFLEKPVCENYNNFTDMVEQSVSVKIPIIINMSRRYHTWYKWIKENYDSGQLGTLIRSDILYYGGWNHNGVHAVDLMHFVFGEQLIKGRIFESWPGFKTTDPTYTARFEASKSRAPVWFHGFSEKYYQVFDCDFKFSKGRLQINNFEERLDWKKAETNSLGERILVNEIADVSDVVICPIVEATQVIKGYLNDSRKERLVNYLLQDLESTMKVVWDMTEKNNV